LLGDGIELRVPEVTEPPRVGRDMAEHFTDPPGKRRNKAIHTHSNSEKTNGLRVDDIQNHFNRRKLEPY
jgi:hypothetical protein